MKSEANKVVMKLQPAQYQLNIQNSVEEIKLMSKHTFTKKLKENGRKMNHSILLEQGEQGKENNKSELIIAEYLLSSNTALEISAKQQMFAVKNRRNSRNSSKHSQS